MENLVAFFHQYWLFLLAAVGIAGILAARWLRDYINESTDYEQEEDQGFTLFDRTVSSQRRR